MANIPFKDILSETLKYLALPEAEYFNEVTDDDLFL